MVFVSITTGCGVARTRGGEAIDGVLGWCVVVGSPEGQVCFASPVRLICLWEESKPCE